MSNHFLGDRNRIIRLSVVNHKLCAEHEVSKVHSNIPHSFLAYPTKFGSTVHALACVYIGMLRAIHSLRLGKATKYGPRSEKTDDESKSQC